MLMWDKIKSITKKQKIESDKSNPVNHIPGLGILYTAKKEHPEFFIHSDENREGMRAYYELKGIELQKKNNRTVNFLTGITIFLTVIIIILTGLQLYNLWETTSPTKPVLEFNTQKNIFFADELIQFYENNHSYFPIRATMGIYAINKGQREAGDVSYHLLEESRNFSVFSWENLPVKPLSANLINFKFGKSDCHSADNDQEYKKNLFSSCDKYKIKGGLMKWYLKVYCNDCQFSENPQCYSFNICIVNSTINEEWCRKQLGGNDISESDECPNDFY